MGAANRNGVVNVMAGLGGAEGKPVALTPRPEMVGQAPDTVTLPFRGLLLATWAVAQVRRRDALYQIAVDAV